MTSRDDEIILEMTLEVKATPEEKAQYDAAMATSRVNVRSHSWVCLGVANGVKTFFEIKEFWHERWECSTCGIHINNAIDPEKYDVFAPADPDVLIGWCLSRTCNEELVLDIMES